MKMKSAKRGKSTSAVEVTNVSVHGFWLLIEGTERLLPFDDFPWFREATIGQLTQVELPSPEHLYWPELDIDLAVESLDHPERFPLVSTAGQKKPRGSNGRGRRRPS
jgi:Protein of unknown function (DUF2442)